MRRTPIAAALLLVLVACSSDGTVRTGETGSLERVDIEAPTEALQALAVIGNGRASQAASATGVDMVVATSIGVNVVDATGTATAISSAVDSPASAVTVSPDGRYAIVEGWERTGTEVWSLGPTPTLVAGFDTPTHAMFTPTAPRS